MNQQQSHISVGTYFALVLGAGLVAFGVVAALLIGGAGLLELARLLVLGLVACGVMVALAVLVRAYRKNDAPPVITEHYYHDGTRTIERTVDNTQRQPMYLPAPSQPGTPLLTADMLRAAFLAGTMQLPNGQRVDVMQDQDQSAGGGWTGDSWNGTIRG